MNDIETIKNDYSICSNEWALDYDIKDELGLFLILSNKNIDLSNISISFLAKLMDESYMTISRELYMLKKYGYIDFSKNTISDEEVYKKLNKKNSKVGCLFCGYNKFDCLDKHHYPIRKKDGGTETIKLCPNCHRLFHVMAGDMESTFNITLLKKCRG